MADLDPDGILPPFRPEAALAAERARREARDRIFHAVDADSPSSIDALAASGAPLDLPGPDGSTALHRAALLGRVLCVHALLDGGAFPAAKDSNGMTPWEAAYRADSPTPAMAASMAAIEGALARIGHPRPTPSAAAALSKLRERSSRRRRELGGLLPRVDERRRRAMP